jgi:radical SAM/Cys-rich protein
MNPFDEKVGGKLQALDLEMLQVNVGLRCNQSCAHCHVQAGPDRPEVMAWPVMQQVLETADILEPRLVDITGGAPELNPHLRPFMESLGKSGHKVQVRTNLTALFEPGLEGMFEFFRDQQAALVASLPCYLEKNVDTQRGDGAYEKSVRALQRLNALGYGVDENLPLNLVYNPGGAFLPPCQAALEADYRRELQERYGIVFTKLLTIANMPIGRFWKDLERRGREQKYLRLLLDSFNPKTVPGLMCRHQVSVGWDGSLHDCDFNLALGLRLCCDIPRHIRDFDPGVLSERTIVTGMHCIGCTAGAGSSCSGALETAA